MYDNINDVGACILTRALTEINSLKTINLGKRVRIEGNRIGDNGILSLSDGISYQTKHEELNISQKLIRQK